MPRKSQLIRYAPKYGLKKRLGRGTSATGAGSRPTGGGLRRAGCGKRGGSMRHHRVPASVRKTQVIKLNKIMKSAAGKSRGSVVKRLKSWALNAHKTAKKYGLYRKGAHVARLGYSAWQAKKGNPARIGYNAPNVD
jgi:hypothetical protein